MNRRDFQKGQVLKVKKDHPDFPGVTGVFEFMGGPDKDVIVLTIEDTPTRMVNIAVDPVDIEM
jgi:hypothetical protein